MPGPTNKQKAPKKKASATAPPTHTIPEPGPPFLEMDCSWPELQDYPEFVAMLESLSPTILQYIARKAYQTGYDIGFEAGFDHHIMETDAQAYRRLKSKGVWAEMEQAERAHASTQTEAPIAIRVREASSQATPATHDAASQANPATHNTASQASPIRRNATSQASPVRCDATSQTPPNVTANSPQQPAKIMGQTPLRQMEPSACETASQTSMALLAPPDAQPPPTAACGMVSEPQAPLAMRSVACNAPSQTTVSAHEPAQMATKAGRIPSQTGQRARDASYHAAVAMLSPQSSPDPTEGSNSWADEVELALSSTSVTPRPTPGARDFSALRSSEPDPFRALRRHTRWRRMRRPRPLTSTLSPRNLGSTTPGTQNRTRDVEPISQPAGLRPTSPSVWDFSASHTSNPNRTGAPRRRTRRRGMRQSCFHTRLDGEPTSPRLDPDPVTSEATRSHPGSIKAMAQPPGPQLPARGVRDRPAFRSSNPNPTQVLEQRAQQRQARRPRPCTHSSQEHPPATPIWSGRPPIGPTTTSRCPASTGTHGKPVLTAERTQFWAAPRPSHSMLTPTGLNWESDPRLAELSRALRALGWIQPPG